MAQVVAAQGARLLTSSVLKTGKAAQKAVVDQLQKTAPSVQAVIVVAEAP